MYRKTIVLTLVLLLLSAIFVVQETREVRGNTVAVPALPEGVDTLIISEGNEELELTRQGERWLVGPQGYPADEELLAELLGTLRELGEREVISGRGNYRQYELTGEGARQLTFFQEGTEILSLTLGANAAAGEAVYGRLNGRPEVILLPRSLRESTPLDASEFRETMMGSIAEEAIREATLTVAGSVAITLTAVAEPEIADGATRMEEIAASWQSVGGDNLEPQDIRDFLLELENIRAREFLDGPPEADPFATVTIELAGGGREELRFFPPTGDDLVPVVSSTSAYPFAVARWRALRLLFGRSELLEPFTDAES